MIAGGEMAMVMQHRHICDARTLLAGQLGQRYRTQVEKYLGIQTRPQFVGHAAAVVEAIFPAAALGRVDGLVHRHDDVGDSHPLGRAGENARM